MSFAHGVTLAVRRRERIPPAKPALATRVLTRRGSDPMRGIERRSRPQLKQPEPRPKPNMRARASVSPEARQTRYREWRGVSSAHGVPLAVRRRERIPPAKPALATRVLTRRGSDPMRGIEHQPRPQLKQPEPRREPNMRARASVSPEATQTRHRTGGPCASAQGMTALKRVALALFRQAEASVAGR